MKCKHLKNNKSFTLSEVLITLVVIGIIAAITVPVIMANHKKTEASSKLKKFYATLDNAIRLAEIENGTPVNEWNYSGNGTSIFEKYLSKYFSIAKFEKDEYREINAKYNAWSGSVYLNDGTLFGFDAPSVVIFDLNGDKGPNTYGRDIFVFETGLYNKRLISDWGVFGEDNDTFDEAGMGVYSRTDLIEACKDQRCCTKLLELDGWEFKDDYPYKL